MDLIFILRQYIGIVLSMAAFAGFAFCTKLERRFDLDQTKIIHVSVGLAVVGLLFHELRPYKRQAGLTFSKEQAEEEWKAREEEIAAAMTKKKK